MSDTSSTQVMPLAQMPTARQPLPEAQPTDETMPLRVVSELKEKGEIHPDSSVTGRLPRRMNGQFAGPFPVRRVGGKLTLRKFAEEAPIEDVVAVVKALSQTEGVEQEKVPSADTGTHALPAVEKMTGKPSEFATNHRIAARVQSLHPGYAVWFGEHTKEFWVMDATGLHSFADVTAMYQGMGWQNL